MNHLNPLVEPTKEYPSNRINIQTRGPPAPVQQLGTLSRMNYVNTDQDVDKIKSHIYYRYMEDQHIIDHQNGIIIQYLIM